MSNLWVNIRVLGRHLQVGRTTLRFGNNPHVHWLERPFYVYEFFGLERWWR